MSESLETLKKARERMIEERDAHVKVLAAPFDRDKAERARNKFLDSDGDRRAGARHQRGGTYPARALSLRRQFRGRPGPHN